MSFLRAPLGQKQANAVSTALRTAARGEECTLRLPCCNGGTETTVLAHLRMFGVAGIGQKPDDWFGVFACAACHDALDRRNSANADMWGIENVLRALHETIRRQIARGNITIKGAK